MLGVGFSSQVCRAHCGIGKRAFNLSTDGHKALGVQEPMGIQILHHCVKIITPQNLALKLSGKGVLNIRHVVLAIQMVGNEKGGRREQNLFFNKAFRVAQTDIALTVVIDRKCIKRSEFWECHRP